MSKWNLLELTKLCEQKGLPIAKVYQNSLAWRWHRAGYHADTASKIWSDLFKESPVSLGGTLFEEAAFSYEAQVEACVLSLHSLADILSQIINVVILGRRFKEDDVSIKRVLEVMEKEGIAPDVVKSTRGMIDDELFLYIEAFSNTIKHRRLINTEFRAEFGEKSRNESGLRFEEFIFKNRTYPQTWGSDILKKYRLHVLDLITEVGLNINRYIAAM